MLTHTYGYLGVVARVVTAPLEQPWEGSACVHTLQGQRGGFGRQPSLAPLTKRMRVAGSEAVALAQPTHRDKLNWGTVHHSFGLSRGRLLVPRLSASGHTSDGRFLCAPPRCPPVS